MMICQQISITDTEMKKVLEHYCKVPITIVDFKEPDMIAYRENTMKSITIFEAEKYIAKYLRKDVCSLRQCYGGFIATIA